MHELFPNLAKVKEAFLLVHMVKTMTITKSYDQKHTFLGGTLVGKNGFYFQVNMVRIGLYI